MPDPEIERFFASRQEAWCLKNIKANMSAQEIAEKKQECADVFALCNWLPNAAKRAGQISMATHPCTFSHPSARKNKNGYVSPIIADLRPRSDGFLRTGNVKTSLDALGNAAALDVYNFLILVMADGQKLLEHIAENTPLSRSLLTQPGSTYEELRNGFLGMSQGSDEIITSSKIKQVYFLLSEQAEGAVDEEDEDYHLLSVLTNSGMVYQLRHRIDAIRFSEATKTARDCRRKNELHDGGYREIYDITTISYGGTKPQNISAFNSQNGGKAHLLRSAPPDLSPRNIRVPTTNFFKETFTPWQCQDLWESFHKILCSNQNTVNIRNDRDRLVTVYTDRVAQALWQLRELLRDYSGELSNTLPTEQIIWLSHDKEEQRLAEDEWLDIIITDVSRSFLNGYKRIKGKQAINLSDEELKAIKKVVEQNKEVLR